MSAETDQYFSKIQHLTSQLVEFMSRQDSSIQTNVDDKPATYTRSSGYQIGVTSYHNTADFALFMLDLIKRIEPHETVVDAGCASGFSGLTLTQYGRPRVTFHDWPGLGLEFLARMIENEPMEQARVVAYGQPIERRHWCLACDVLEHTGNHLAALKWFETLGHKVALCYPVSVRFQPPYVSVIDEWVDDEMIQAAIAKRHTILDTYIRDGRRYTIYEVKL